MSASPPQSASGGYPAAFGAYVIWGFLPLYLLTVSSVPAFEFVGWRVVWTVPFCLLMVALRGQGPALKAAIRTRSTVARLALSAVLIGANWLIYVWSIQNGYVLATSMGYYLNPLFNIALGTALLGERLSVTQWAAVALAAIAVAILLTGDVGSLLVALSLAATFAFYGLVRRQVPVGAVPGLTVETAILLLPSFAIIAWYAGLPQGSSFVQDPALSLLIMLGGVLTALPLLLFAVAARRLPFSTLGFIQFIAPSIVFLLGLFAYGEELHTAKLAAFILIWIAIALFIADLLRKRGNREAR